MQNRSGLLDGYAIGVTADRRADEQISLLAGRGADCMHGPTVRTHPIRAEAEIRAATEQLIADPTDFVVATTGIGVRGWLEAADALELLGPLKDALGRTRLFVRGPKAHGAAITAGLAVEWNAETATTAEIITHLKTAAAAGDRVAIQVDGAPDQPIVNEIEALGLDVLVIPVYRWSLPADQGPAEALIRAVAERRVDAVTFTSRPAAQNFAQIATELDLREEVESAFASDVVPCCVGSISAEGLAAYPDVEPLVPERFRLGAMVQTLTERLRDDAFEATIAGLNVHIQGRRIEVEEEEPVQLSVRERQLLGALLDRPGVVRSKTYLLDEVWRASGSNPHLVEVTVGRLRKRLGCAGIGIETVMKRGYRASPD